MSSTSRQGCVTAWRESRTRRSLSSAPCMPKKTASGSKRETDEVDMSVPFLTRPATEEDLKNFPEKMVLYRVNGKNGPYCSGDGFAKVLEECLGCETVPGKKPVDLLLSRWHKEDASMPIPGI